MDMNSRKQAVVIETVKQIEEKVKTSFEVEKKSENMNVVTENTNSSRIELVDKIENFSLSYSDKIDDRFVNITSESISTPTVLELSKFGVSNSSLNLNKPTKEKVYTTVKPKSTKKPCKTTPRSTVSSFKSIVKTTKYFPSTTSAPIKTTRYKWVVRSTSWPNYPYYFNPAYGYPRFLRAHMTTIAPNCPPCELFTAVNFRTTSIPTKFSEESPKTTVLPLTNRNDMNDLQYSVNVTSSTETIESVKLNITESLAMSNITFPTENMLAVSSAKVVENEIIDPLTLIIYYIGEYY